MADAYPLTAARSRLGELVNRARYGRERIILSEHGTPVAAIISVDELDEMQAALDAADVALAHRVIEAGQPGVPHEQVMAAFDALDQADRANTAAEAEEILRPHKALLERAMAAGAQLNLDR